MPKTYTSKVRWEGLPNKTLTHSHRAAKLGSGFAAIFLYMCLYTPLHLVGNEKETKQEEGRGNIACENARKISNHFISRTIKQAINAVD